MKQQIERKRIAFRILLAAYLLALFYFLFFAELMGREIGNREYAYNLQLFKEIHRFLSNVDKLGVKSVFLNIAGNMIGFIPFGILVPLSFQRVRGGFFITLLTLTSSLVIETIQLVFRVGSFDVDDIILNTIGGIIGYMMYFTIRAIIRACKKKAN